MTFTVCIHDYEQDDVARFGGVKAAANALLLEPSEIVESMAVYRLEELLGPK